MIVLSALDDLETPPCIPKSALVGAIVVSMSPPPEKIVFHADNVVCVYVCVCVCAGARRRDPFLDPDLYVMDARCDAVSVWRRERGGAWWRGAFMIPTVSMPLGAGKQPDVGPYGLVTPNLSDAPAIGERGCRRSLLWVGRHRQGPSGQPPPGEIVTGAASLGA